MTPDTSVPIIFEICLRSIDTTCGNTSVFFAVLKVTFGHLQYDAFETADSGDAEVDFGAGCVFVDAQLGRHPVRDDGCYGACIDDEVAALSVDLERHQQEIAEIPDGNGFRTCGRRRALSGQFQLAGRIVYGDQEVGKDRLSQDSIRQLRNQRIVERADGDVVHLHIADRQLFDFVKLGFDLSGAADAKDDGGGDLRQADLGSQFFAQHRLGCARVDGELIGTFAVDLQAGKDQVQRFPELDRSRFLRSVDHAHFLDSEGFEHLEPGLCFRQRGLHRRD